MTRMTRPIMRADEQDVFTDWRRLYTYTQRAGKCRSVKRRANRNERHNTKNDIRRNPDESA